MLSNHRGEQQVTAPVGDGERLAFADADRERAVQCLDDRDLPLVEIGHVHEAQWCCCRTGHVDLPVAPVFGATSM
jgi:hypothetical protein